MHAFVGLMLYSLVQNPNRILFFRRYKKISSPFLPPFLLSHSMSVPLKGHLHSLLACRSPLSFSFIYRCNSGPSFDDARSFIDTSLETPRGFFTFVFENFLLTGSMIKIALAGTSGLAQYIAHYISTQTYHQFFFLSRNVS